MDKTEMPSPDEIRRLLRGEFEGDEARDLYARLAEHEEALELAEGIWAEESPLASDLGPQLSDRRSETIKRRLFIRVRRTQLAEDVTGLGTGAFLYVVLGLLGAVFSAFETLGETPSTSRRREI